MSKKNQPIVAAGGLVVTLLLGSGCQSGLTRYLNEPEPIAQARTLDPVSVARVAPAEPAPAGERDDELKLTEADILAARVAAYAERVEAADANPAPVITPTLDGSKPAPKPVVVKPTEVVEAEVAEVPVIEAAGAVESEVQWSEPEPVAELAPPDAEFAEPGKVHPAQPAEAQVPEAQPAAAAASDVTMELGGRFAGVTPMLEDVPALASVDELQEELDARIAADPRDVQAHLERQVINWLRNEPAPDPTQIADLPVADRELISAVIDGLTNLRITLNADGTLMQQDRVAPILEMAERLRDAGTLSLGEVVLCHSITGFGLYEAMPPAFPAKIPSGWAGQALLYAEVDGFASTLVENAKWETRLTEQCTLYSNTGLQVWSGPENEVIDRSHNKRRDFHISKVLRLPEDLPPGAYTLKLTLTDQTSNRLTEQTIGLRITRPEKPAVR
ncbi:MAG: hypothetical protein AAGD32_11500 [Planctomycetota bacterium]